MIYFIISLRLALLGSTTKPRKARVVRASPLGDSIEVDRCTSDVRFHPRYRKLLALLLPVVDRLHRVVSFPPLPNTPNFFFFFPRVVWFRSAWTPTHTTNLYDRFVCLIRGPPREGIRKCSGGVFQGRQSGGRNLLPFLARSPGSLIPLHPDSPFVSGATSRGWPLYPPPLPSPPPHGHGSCVWRALMAVFVRGGLWKR